LCYFFCGIKVEWYLSLCFVLILCVFGVDVCNGLKSYSICFSMWFLCYGLGVDVIVGLKVYSVRCIFSVFLVLKFVKG